MGNNKKLRGRRRACRSLRLWEAREMFLDTDILRRVRSFVAEPCPPPWGNLPFDHLHAAPAPSPEFAADVMRSMVRVYFSWRERLTGWGEPYSLHLALAAPCLWYSAVVARTGENIRDTEPYPLQDTPGVPPWSRCAGDIREQLAGFSWNVYRHETLYPAEELVWRLYPKRPDNKRNRLRYEPVSVAGEPWYREKLGMLWIGKWNGAASLMEDPPVEKGA